MKNIIVTGAAGQIGQLFIKYLSSLDTYKIYAIDKSFTNIAKEDTIEYVNLDITKEDQVNNFFKTLDSVEVLINNAGIGVFTPFEERTAEDFMSVLEVNMLGTFLMCRESIKIMKATMRGKIINIGSIYGMVSSDPRIYGNSGRNNSEVYSMSKAGVIMLTKYLSTHYAHYNIQVNSISPGGLKREQSQDFLSNYSYRTPSGRLASVKDLIPALDFLISSNNTYTTGQNIAIDGGFTAW
jgi:3-oxoacyl-[acyl-carrier protein] reductase